MIIQRIDWDVRAAPSRQALLDFAGEVDAILSEQPGCLGAVSWGSGTSLHVVSGWEDRKLAATATSAIGHLEQRSAERGWSVLAGPPTTRVSRTVGRASVEARSVEHVR